MSAFATTIISLAISAVIAVIAFFLKRTIGRVDENDKKLGDLAQNLSGLGQQYVALPAYTKDIDSCERSIEKIKADYTPRSLHTKELDECRKDIKDIKDDYITKEDFYREQSKTDRKLDKIMDILLQMKGDRNGE